MMKRIMAIVLAVMLMMCAQSALANEAGMTAEKVMIVANCNDWVSMRTDADKSSERLAEVPKGAVVACRSQEQGFAYCEYDGMTGYIMTDYLEEAEVINGIVLVTERDYNLSSESMNVMCYDAQGHLRWKRTISTTQVTELNGTAAFVAGIPEQPRVAQFTFDGGLTLVDGFTGDKLWTLTCEESGLSGGPCWAVGADGTMYIGGYYGPDPVAISMEGEVLWQVKAQEDAYWLYEIEVTDEGIVCTYDCIGEHAASGRICYGFDGTELWVDMD